MIFFGIIKEILAEQSNDFIHFRLLDHLRDPGLHLLEVRVEVLEVALDQPGDPGVGSRFHVLRPDLRGEFFGGLPVGELLLEVFVDEDLPLQEEVEAHVEVELAELLAELREEVVALDIQEN